MGLSYAEQETVIIFDREGAEMNVYTANKYLLERLMKLDTYRLVKEHTQNGELVAADFKADKRLLTLRSKRPANNLTDEQKEKMRQAREKKNE